MKRVIKNILIIFVIVFSILNIIGVILNKVNLNKTIHDYAIPLTNGEVTEDVKERENDNYNRYKERYGQDAPPTILSYFEGYAMGNGNYIQFEETILLFSAIVSLSVGIIASLTDKSKVVKELIIFIALGLIIAVLITVYIHLTRNLQNVEFLDGFGRTLIDDVIRTYGLIYIEVYLVVYVIKYLIGKNNAKKLNNEIKNKE
jgi:hypothetical protein